MSTSAPFVRDPQFGRDPWLNEATKPSSDAIAQATASVRYTGADAFQINLLPDGLDAYMSYVDNFGGWDALLARFGAKNEYNGVPVVYTSAGNLAAVNAAVGGRKIIRWSAHYGFGPHICGPGTCGYPQADWTQWDDHGAHGENIDRSIGRTPLGGKPTLVSITIFGKRAHCADVEPGAMSVGDLPNWLDHVAIPAKPQPPSVDAHYDWYDSTPRWAGRFVERSVVEEYDKLRALMTPTSKPAKARLRLYQLRALCGSFAARVWAVAHMPGKGGFGVDHRGWRWQQLIHRAQGKKVV